MVDVPKVAEQSSDAVVERGVSFEEYLARYAHDHYEWVAGEVIKMAPIHMRHDDITRYLDDLFEIYFELKPIGLIRSQPFVMRLPAAGVAREPDLQVILNSNPNATPTYVDGPADICIEVVSPESVERDHGTKFAEYEKGGVPEYWIVDPLREECRFYRLNEKGVYTRHAEDGEGNYRSPALPGLALHVPTLWQDNLPGPIAISRTVQSMLEVGI